MAVLDATEPLPPVQTTRPSPVIVRSALSAYELRSVDDTVTVPFSMASFTVRSVSVNVTESGPVVALALVTAVEMVGEAGFSDAPAPLMSIPLTMHPVEVRSIVAKLMLCPVAAVPAV
jgi:hypothetical protein